MIKFTTINVDGNEVSRQFNTIQEVLINWWSEEGTDLPSADDEVISFVINEVEALKPLRIFTFDKVIQDLTSLYWRGVKELKA